LRPIASLVSQARNALLAGLGERDHVVGHSLRGGRRNDGRRLGLRLIRLIAKRFKLCPQQLVFFRQPIAFRSRAGTFDEHDFDLSNPIRGGRRQRRNSGLRHGLDLVQLNQVNTATERRTT
jgi:hypothetical protein